MSKQTNIRSDRYAIRCLNGLKHGSSARKLLLPDENPAEFYALLQEAFFSYQPNTKRDAHFVADLAHARWFLLRRERAYTYYEQGLHLQKPAAETWTAHDYHQLQLLNRYKVEARRAVERALHNLQHFDKEGRRIRPWQDLHHELKESLIPDEAPPMAA